MSDEVRVVSLRVMLTGTVDSSQLAACTCCTRRNVVHRKEWRDWSRGNKRKEEGIRYTGETVDGAA